MKYKSLLNNIQAFLLLINKFVIPASCFMYAYIDVQNGLDFVVHSGSDVSGA